MSFSGQSNSSFGSGIGSEDSENQIETQDESQEEEIDSSLEGGVFGLMYAVTKEKSDSWSFAVIRLLLDWLQVTLLLVNPAWGWQIDIQHSWWRAFAFVGLDGLKYSVTVRGYEFHIIFMYLMFIALVAVLGLCTWAALGFRHGQFDRTWAISTIHAYNMIFVKVIHVATLSVFLICWDCGYFSSPYVSAAGYLVELPAVRCFEMPHMIHQLVSMVAAVGFVALGCVMTMGDVEPNPLGDKPMAMAHSRTELLCFSLKMAMTFCSFFITGLRWMAVFQFIMVFFLAYLYLRWLPHQQAIVNHIRVGSTFSIFWTAMLFLILTYGPGADPNDPKSINNMEWNMTIALYAGTVPMFLIGAALSVWRTRYLTVTVPNKFRDAAPGTKPRRIYKFWDAREVEIVTRCCRKWEDAEHELLDPDTTDLALNILKAGVALLPRQPYATILLGAFQTNVMNSHQSGRLELKAARRMPSVSVLDRYYLHVLEQENTAKSISIATNGEGDSIDLQTYVEHQRNYKLTLLRHMDSLMATRTFWQTLLHRNVTFNKLVRAVQQIETSTRIAEKQYKQALTRHSTSVDLLNLYVKFLAVARYDPWAAAKWTAEVEKLQRQEEEENHRVLLGQEDSAKNQGGNNKAVIVMGANCIIRMANDAAAAVLGYPSRAELVGRNVNIIVPPPFAANHNQYVRNYIETGEGQVIGRLREFVALHRDGYVVPVMVLINKVSGIGEDSVFMAAFDVLSQEPNTASTWILNSGQVLSCDQVFTDWFGYRHEDLQSEQMSDLLVEPQILEDLFFQIRTAFGTENTKRAGGAHPTEWVLNGVSFKHLYRDHPILVDLQVSVGGVGSTSLFRIRVRLCEGPEPPLLCCDGKGRIVHITSSLASQLGKGVAELQAGRTMHALDALLPLPFAKLHHMYCRQPVDAPLPYSCTSGLTVPVSAYDPAHGACIVPFKIKMKRKEVPGREPVVVAVMEERTMEQMLAERRVKLVVDGEGIVQNVSETPVSLFGFEMAGLTGSHLSYVIDILQLGASGGDPALGSKEQLKAAAGMLKTMAQKSYDCPGGMSWRVGVTPVMEPATLLALGPIGVAMMAKRMVPAVMCVQPYMEDTAVEGAEIILPPHMLYQVTLWRADMLTGVLEVDPFGMVEGVGMKGQSYFDPSYLLGLPSELMLGAHISSLVPCGRAHIESLFTEGSMQPLKGGKRGGPGAHGGRGAMRHNNASSARKNNGPRHSLRITHGTDGADLEVEVQAVVKQNLGGSSSLFVIFRAVAPRCGRAEFAQWLSQQGPPTFPVEREHAPLGSMSMARPSLDLQPGRFEGGPRRASVDAGAGVWTGKAGGAEKKGGGIHWEEANDSAVLADLSAHEVLEWSGHGEAPLPGAGTADEAVGGSKESDGDGDTSAHDTGAAPSEAGDGDDPDEDGRELDQAGQALAELKRGKRVKRLTKLLMSPLAQSPHVLLARMSIAMVILLVVVDIVMFFIFHNLLAVQKDQVNDLRSTSKAINRVMQICIQTSAMRILLDGKGQATLRHLGQGGLTHTGYSQATVQADLTYITDLLEIKVTELDTYHRGVFRGFSKVAPITASYGLREIWEEPALPMRVFYDKPDGTQAINVNMSLWDAGNEYILKTRTILQNWKSLYGLQTNNSAAFQNDTDVLFIVHNAPRELTVAYQTTLDGLMQKAVDDSAALNSIQLIILAVEGAVVGIMTVVIMYIVASKSVMRRFAIFSIFMAVPAGVLRTLANAPFKLGAGTGDDQVEDEDHIEAEKTENDDAYADGNDYMPQKPTVRQQYRQREAQEAAAKVKLGNTEGDGEGQSWVSRLMFWRPQNTSFMTAKRRLQTSPLAVLSFVWPFCLWAILVILLNMFGFFSLKSIAAPIAISNIVQFMNVRVNRVILFSERYVSRQYFTTDFTAVAPDLPAGIYNPLSAPLKALLAAEYPLLRQEYAAMLYGNAAPGLEDTQDPHFKLATKGITFMPGSELMFTSTQCMSLTIPPQYPADCYTTTDPFYRFTTTGLDQAMKELFTQVESLIMAPYDEVNMKFPGFEYIWEVSNGHITGGLIKLTDVFSATVVAVYQQAEQLHLVALILCIALGIMFIFFVQRPASARVIAESRRIGQLMSSIPAEIDVEGLLAQTMAMQSVSKEGLATALELAASAKASARVVPGSKKLKGV